MGLKTWKMLEVQRAGWKSEQHGLAAQKLQHVGLLVRAAGKGLVKEVQTSPKPGWTWAMRLAVPPGKQVWDSKKLERFRE